MLMNATVKVVPVHVHNTQAVYAPAHQQLNNSRYADSIAQFPIAFLGRALL